jgi:hypothetical protein
MPHKHENPEEDNEQTEKMEVIMRQFVKKGIMEQYIGEDGHFYFALTEFGKEIAKELKEMQERGEDYLDDY